MRKGVIRANMEAYRKEEMIRLHDPPPGPPKLVNRKYNKARSEEGDDGQY